eukprot:8907828-Alexandrium_andersonii.AAC.1
MRITRRSLSFYNALRALAYGSVRLHRCLPEALGQRRTSVTVSHSTFERRTARQGGKYDSSILPVGPDFGRRCGTVCICGSAVGVPQQ